MLRSAPRRLSATVSMLMPRHLGTFKMTRMIEIKVPDIGGVADIAVIEVLIKVGESVEAEQGLITLETGR